MQTVRNWKLFEATRRGALSVLAGALFIAAAAPVARAQSFGGEEHVPDESDLPPLLVAEQRDFERGKTGRRTETPNTAAGWRGRAEELLAQKEWTKASDAYRQASLIYGARGDINAAKILETLAQRYETQIGLFYQRPVNAALAAKNFTAKRLEPVYGAYIGAFIDREDGVTESYKDENFQTHKSSQEFNRIAGKRHASYFMYNQYGKIFPAAWFEHLRDNGAAAQWVVLPNSLDDIKDDAYLKSLAEAVRDARLPVFIRWAGEMNGSWVPYHGDPAKYIEKFRLAARVFHATAPNAAMVWCPNDIPQGEIDKYYPGEDAVDWVGVNFYNVYFNDNNPQKPAWWRNPADNLDYMYKTYSGRHPLMIGECGASHLSAADNVARPDFVVDKIGQLYASLPRRYPRVKAVNWFSMNAIKYAPPARRLNDYSLLEQPAVAAQYRAMIASPYFLESVSLTKPAQAPQEIVALAPQTTVAGRVLLSAWVKTVEQRPRVTYTITGAASKPPVTRAFDTPAGAYEWAWDTTGFSNGPARIVLEVRDKTGALLSTMASDVIIRNTPGTKPPVDSAPARPKLIPRS